MLISATKVTIMFFEQDALEMTFEIGKTMRACDLENAIVSHITIDTDNKVIMVRDQQNYKKLFGYASFDADISPVDDDGMNVLNHI